MPEIRITVHDEQVNQALKELAGKMKNLSPVMKAIGEYLLRSTEDRFNRQGPAPDGSPWAPLKASTLKRKKHGKILTESGHLRGSIRYQLQGPSSVAIGTNRVYAAIHQLGGKTSPSVIVPRTKKALFWPGAAHPVKSVRHPGSVIPARPFLGVSARDGAEIVSIINRYLSMR
jgi:phage virion morphogenesis protein